MSYKAAWYDKPNNMGDVLTPHILDYYKIAYQRVNFDTANLICVGSIAHLAKPNVTVLGSGAMFMNRPLNRDANWVFVRGPLTRNIILQNGGNCPELYGDPALLISRMITTSKKKYDVAIVPHYQDFRRIKLRYGLKYKIINVVNRDPLQVVAEIAKCRAIISSSLHGIIVSHALGIPAAHVEFSPLWGDGTKFIDYFSSIGVQHKLSTMQDLSFSCPDNLDTETIHYIMKSYGQK